jgi:hypothetical protein
MELWGNPIFSTCQKYIVLSSFTSILELPFDDFDIRKQLAKIAIGDFTIPSNAVRHISNHARNLVYAILNPNPHKRPTIHKILKTKWLTNAKDDDSPDEYMSYGMNAVKFSVMRVNDESNNEIAIPRSIINH